MLTELCGHLRNWFDRERYAGTFTVENGSVALPFLHEGQYFRIIGSTFNDGVHQYPAYGLTDETFDGAVWALAIPPSVLALDAEIEAWQAKNGDASASPYSSESFGGYSYSRATDAKTGGAVTWQSAFRSKLNQWRKL